VGGKSIRIEDFLQSHVILRLTRSDQKPAPRVNFDVGNFRVQRTGHPHHGQSVGLKLFLIKASTSMARMSWPVLASPGLPRIPTRPPRKWACLLSWPGTQVFSMATAGKCVRTQVPGPVYKPSLQHTLTNIRRTHWMI